MSILTAEWYTLTNEGYRVIPEEMSRFHKASDILVLDSTAVAIDGLLSMCVVLNSRLWVDKASRGKASVEVRGNSCVWSPHERGGNSYW